MASTALHPIARGLALTLLCTCVRMGASEPGKVPGKVLLLTDLHLDRYYGTSSSYNSCNSNTTPFGKYVNEISTDVLYGAPNTRCLAPVCVALCICTNVVCYSSQHLSVAVSMAHVLAPGTAATRL